MTNYKILEVKCEVNDLAMYVVTSIKYYDGIKERWFNLVEIEGMPSVYITNDDIFEKLLYAKDDDDEFINLLNNSYVEEFEGVPIAGVYEPTMEYFQKNKGHVVQFVRYAIYITRCDMQDLDEAIQLGVKHNIDEIEIPISDIEQDYIDDIS